jgi:hypothetical protein
MHPSSRNAAQRLGGTIQQYATTTTTTTRRLLVPRWSSSRRNGGGDGDDSSKGCGGGVSSSSYFHHGKGTVASQRKSTTTTTTSLRLFSSSSSNGNFGDFPWENHHLGPLHPQPLVTTGGGENATTTTTASMRSQQEWLLDEASAEGRRIFDRARENSSSSSFSPLLASKVTSPLLATRPDTQPYVSEQHEKTHPGTDHHHDDYYFFLEDSRMKYLEDAADSLLAATKVTIPLAQVITYSCINNKDGDDRVRFLHRAFLSILQKCISALIQNAVSTENTTTTATHESSSSSSWKQHTHHSSSRRRCRSSSSTPLFSPASEPPLLDKTLRLAVRARGDLGLPLHLPLYQSLAVSVAQSSESSATITRWILQAGRWAQEDFGPACITANSSSSIRLHPDDDDDDDDETTTTTTIMEEFFARPLYHLAERKRYAELVDVLLLILHAKDFDAMEYLHESTVQGILHRILPDLQTLVWEPPSTSTSNYNHRRRRPISPQQQQSFSDDALALEEILLLLEPSIWKVFGYDTVSPERATSLRDAIDVLLSPPSSLDKNHRRPPPSSISNTRGTDNGGNDDDDDDKASSRSRDTFSSSVVLPESPELLQALFPEEFPDDFPFPDSDEDEESSSSSSSSAFGETTEHLTSGNASWEFHVDMDSEVAVVGVTRVFPDNDDEDDEDSSEDGEEGSHFSHWSTETLYTRSMLAANLPDVVHQIEQVTGKPLQYSKRLEKDLIRQLNDPYGEFD